MLYIQNRAQFTDATLPNGILEKTSTLTGNLKWGLDRMEVPLYIRGKLVWNRMETGALESFEYFCCSKNLSKKTLRSYRQSVTYFGIFIRDYEKNLLTATKEDIRRFLFHKLQACKATTVNHYLRDLRVFYGFLADEDYIGANVAEGIPFCKEERKTPRIISPEEFTLVIKKCRYKKFTTQRDKMMLLVTWECMLRLNELLSIKLTDINWNHRLIKIRGKGAKYRTLAFSYRVASKLVYYTKHYRHGIDSEYLFPTRNGTRVSEPNAWKIFKWAGDRAGVKINPHLIRHSAATEFWRRTGDIHMTQLILGHSKVETTEKIYVHSTEEDVRRQYEKYSPSVSLNI